MDRLIARHHVGPVLGVMVGVDGGQDGVVHVPVLVTAGKVDEIEFHGLRVSGFSCDHAGAVAGVAIVNQREAIVLKVKHRDRMVVFRWVQRRTGFLPLVHDGISPGGYAY